MSALISLCRRQKIRHARKYDPAWHSTAKANRRKASDAMTACRSEFELTALAHRCLEKKSSTPQSNHCPSQLTNILRFGLTTAAGLARAAAVPASAALSPGS